MSAATKVPDRSLADQVYRHVSDRILSSQLVSGETIDRKRLAGQLNVSMAPVVEALNRLS